MLLPRIADQLIPELRQMQYLAFYQTQVFGRDAFAVNYYAEIERISTAPRIELLPDEAGHQNAEALYYKLEISPLQGLSQSIPTGNFPTTTFVATDSKQTEQTPTARHFHYDDTREIQCGAGD
jgi:hypothetical protein